MLNQYIISKRERRLLSCFICDGRDFLSSVFEQLPERIQRHSKRTSTIAGMIAEHMPEHLLPYGMDRFEYRLAMMRGAYYHKIGVYLALNDVKNRPVMAEKLLNENWYTCDSPQYRKVLLETVKNCCEEYDGTGYPDGLRGTDIPFHATVCLIASIVDMFMRLSPYTEAKAKRATEYIRQNNGIRFRADAVECFERAKEKIFDLYINQSNEVLAAAAPTG